MQAIRDIVLYVYKNKYQHLFNCFKQLVDISIIMFSFNMSTMEVTNE